MPRSTLSHLTPEEKKARHSKQSSDWNKAHKELHAARCKRWRQNNRDKVRKLKREWSRKQRLKNKFTQVAKDCALKAVQRV